MQYPTYEAISHPASDLTVSQFTIIRPLIPGVQVQFRKAIRSGGCRETELCGILAKFAIQVLRDLSALEDLNGHPDIPSLRRAMGLEAGAAETALRYAHFVYKDIANDRMLFTWHKQIADALADEIDRIEDRWWELQLARTELAMAATQGEAAGGQSKLMHSSAGASLDPQVQMEPLRHCTRQRIDDFIAKVRQHSGRRITRTEIWRVAGYTEATEFQRFQRRSRISATAAQNFERILSMSPEIFLRKLEGHENTA